MPGEATFGNSVAQHLPYLKRMIRGLTRNDAITEDIVQQTVLKALIHADQFRFESTLKTWLTSIAKNESRQVYRCKWRTCSVPLTADTLEHEPSSDVDSPSLSYQVSEREVLIRQAVARLPGPYRSVVELCDLQSLSLREAAARLRLTIPAVKARLQRGRKKLRRSVLELKP